jgi:hypothetical protein
VNAAFSGDFVPPGINGFVYFLPQNPR